MVGDGPRQPLVDEAIHAFPGHARPLASPFEKGFPENAYLSVKALQRLQIEGHTVVAIVPDEH